MSYHVQDHINHIQCNTAYRILGSWCSRTCYLDSFIDFQGSFNRKEFLKRRFSNRACLYKSAGMPKNRRKFSRLLKNHLVAPSMAYAFCFGSSSETVRRPSGNQKITQFVKTSAQEYTGARRYGYWALGHHT